MLLTSIRSIALYPVKLTMLATAVAVLTIGGSNAPQAAPIKTTILFEASGFGDEAPTNPVVGSVSLFFDPAGNEIVEGSIEDLSLEIAGHAYSAGEVGFNYSPTESNGKLVIGGFVTGVGLIQFPVDWFDFIIGISNVASGAPIFESMLYTVSTSFYDVNNQETVADDIPTSNSVIIIITDPPTYLFGTDIGDVTFIVSEPNTFLLLAFGLLGLGALRLRFLPV